VQALAKSLTRRMFSNGIADKPLRHFAKAFPGKTELRDAWFCRFCKAEPLRLKIAQDLIVPGPGCFAPGLILILSISLIMILILIIKVAPLSGPQSAVACPSVC